MTRSIKNPTTVRRAMRSYARHRKSSHCRGKPRENCTKKVGCFWTHGKDRSFCRKIQVTKRGSQSCDCPSKRKTFKKNYSNLYKSFRSKKNFRGGASQGCVTMFGAGANCINSPNVYNNSLDFTQAVPVKKYIPFKPLHQDISLYDQYSASTSNTEYAPYNS